MKMNENVTPPPFDGGNTPEPPAPEQTTPMYGSTASGPTDTPADDSIDLNFLAHIHTGFWD